LIFYLASESPSMAMALSTWIFDRGAPVGQGFESSRFCQFQAWKRPPVKSGSGFNFDLALTISWWPPVDQANAGITSSENNFTDL
jgi:hypothetical protein